MVPRKRECQAGEKTGTAGYRALSSLLCGRGDVAGNRPVKRADEILSLALKIFLILWAIWISREMGVKPKEVGDAIKNFNASFGVSLPPRREGEKVGNNPGPNLKGKSDE